MKILNAEARRYLHQVQSWLPCSRKPKERILEEISVTLTEFLSSNSSAGYADFIARFGTPQQIAASYVSEMETGTLLRDLRIRRRIVSIVMLTATILITLWTGLVTASYLDHRHNMDGYLVVGEVTVIDRFETSPEGD